MDRENVRQLPPEVRFANAQRGITQQLQLGGIKSESPTMLIAERKDLHRLTVESGGIWNIEDVSGERDESYLVQDLATAVQVYAYYSNEAFRQIITSGESEEVRSERLRQHLSENGLGYQEGVLGAMEQALSRYLQG